MPDWHAYVRSKLPSLGIRAERELEIVDELALQLEAAYEAAIARGLEEAVACRVAETEVPDWGKFAAAVVHIEQAAVSTPLRVEEPVRSAREPLRGFANDISLAARSLWRARAFTSLAVLIVAVGLGIGTAAFSLIDGVLLAPLPYARPERLMLVHATVPPEGRETVEVTYPDAWDLATETTVFANVAAALPFAGSTTLTDPPSRVEGLQVSPDFFAVFGVHPTLGRTFEDRDAAPGAERVVILGHAFWQLLGAPTDIVGRPISIDELPSTIVGVAPPAFRFDLIPNGQDVFLPVRSDNPISSNRGLRAFRVVARLRDDVGIEQAQAVASTVGDRLQRSFPETNLGRSFSLHSLQSEIVGPVRSVLLLVSGLVGLVLVVAGVNLASLLLIRSVGRARETAMRLALGASQWRLVREWIAEGLVVGAVGSAGGLAVAHFLLNSLRQASGLAIPRLAEVGVDWRPAAALALMAAGTVASTALVPLGVLRRLHSLSGARSGHETTDQMPMRARALLVSGQIACAFILLVSAALLAVSLRNVLTQPLGFETDGAVTMRIAVPAVRYQTRESTVALFRELLEGLREHPTVSRAGFVSTLPLAGNTGSTLSIQGREEVPLAVRPTVGWQWASPGYFSAMGMPLIRGRDFSDADVQRTPHVTVINETLARQSFPAEDPIGKRVYFGGYSGSGPPEWHEVIGIVGDVRHSTLEGAPGPRAYDLFGQHWGRTVTLVVRTPHSAPQAAGVVRSILAQRDPRLAVFAVRPMREILAGAVATRRLLLWLVGGFSAAGLFVVLVGLYGTVSYTVERRRREMAVRVALGATRAHVRRLILQYGFRIVAAGIAVGCVGTVSLKHVLDTQLFGVTAVNPGVLAATTVILTAAALIACAIPAERALRTDPAQCLRCE